MASARTVRAPEFPADLSWLNTAEPLRLADLRGRFVLLDFWTYCCINCQHILPELAQLEQQFANELTVIGVHSAKFTDEAEVGNIRSAILRHDIAHPVLVDDGMRVWREYAVRAWPTLVLIDPQGYIVGAQAGEITAAGFAPILAAQIAAARAAGTLQPGPLTFAREAESQPATVLRFPAHVLADPDHNRLILADTGHHRLLVCGFDGTVQQTIGGPLPGLHDGGAASARFNSPQGLALDGDTLWVADTQNHALRRVDLGTSEVTTIVGHGGKPTAYNQPGRGTAVALHSPWAVAVHDGLVYVANAGSHQLWVVDPTTREARPFAGSAREDLIDGLAVRAALAQPSALARLGDRLAFVDSETSSVRWVTLDANPQVGTWVGTGLFDFGDIDGDRRVARLQHPLGLAELDGQLYVADTYNNRIKHLDPATGVIRTFAGSGAEGTADGELARAEFDEPTGLSADEGRLWVADTNNHVIRRIDLAAGTVSTLRLRQADRARPVSADAPAVPLPPQALDADTLTVQLTVIPRVGLHRSPGTALTLAVTANDERTVYREDDGGLEGTFTIDVPPSATELRLEAVAYLCQVDGSGACEMASESWRLPIDRQSDVPATPLALTLAAQGAG